MSDATQPVSSGTACKCHGQGEGPSLEERVERLAFHYRDLARRMAEYMSEASLDRPERNTRAVAAAAELNRIIGGREVAAGEFPECCLIGDISAGGFLRRWYCTGTLIHPRVVITAEHCIFNDSVGALRPNAVALNVNRETAVDPTSDELIRIAKTVKHPTEDLALLILRRASGVAPVASATADELASADRVELVGFGNSDPTGAMGFGIKRQVNVPMQAVRRSPDEDLSEVEAALGFNSFTEFVAGRKGSGQDSCNGDSGGPAYVMVGGERRLAGATSRATDEALDNCGDGGIYVRVGRQREWIDQTIQELVGG